MFYLIAILTPCSGALESFRRYERKAARIMARHGGAIERTFVEDGTNSAQPGREVHIVSFPDSAAFQRYRSDPDLLALAEERTASIAHTEVIIGREGPNYMAPPKY